jgi:nucleotide-binding universal stress UspA family protein
MHASQSKEEPYVILAGIDFSTLSDLALERACDLAGVHRRCQLHVVYVEARTTRLFAAGALASPGDAQADDLKQQSARLGEHVEQVVRRWRDAHSGPPSFERLTTHVRLEPVAESIVQLASDIEAKLIVLGTHGHRGARRFLLGSVAEATVRLAACDVLVVRPPDATVPKIEPPCARCLETRRATNGAEQWCKQHREHHERRHTLHFAPAPAGHQSGLLIHAK